MVELPEHLTDLLPSLRKAQWVAMDTEADSIHCYPEKLCLIQLSYPAGEALVDPLAPLELEALLRILAGRELVLHGADYDLRLLHRAYGFVPEHVFDTMLAARFLGLKEFGLIDLVGRFLGVRLVKGSQKANWARRPLTPTMLDYALNDARYLHPLAELLREQLVVLGRLEWHREACARLIRECAHSRPRDPDQIWRLPGSDRLAPAALAVLRAAWHWREQEAILHSKPPFFVLSHDSLVALASRAVEGAPLEPCLPQRWPDHRRQALLKVVTKTLGQHPSHYPHACIQQPRRFTDAENQRLNDLKRRRDQIAHRLEMDPSFIASRSLLVSLIRDQRNDGLMQWQKALLKA
jgi:ribonuclease D